MVVGMEKRNFDFRAGWAHASSNKMEVGGPVGWSADGRRTAIDSLNEPAPTTLEEREEKRKREKKGIEEGRTRCSL